jgi:hypothetical protein
MAFWSGGGPAIRPVRGPDRPSGTERSRPVATTSRVTGGYPA